MLQEIERKVEMSLVGGVHAAILEGTIFCSIYQHEGAEQISTR